MTDVNFPQIPNQNEHGEDWQYRMRREMQEIIPGLFLGPYASAMKSKLNDLKNHGVSHIVCIRQDIESHFVKPNFPEHFRYLVIDIADTVTENIIQHFPKVKEFIDSSIKKTGIVLVHGNAGISRSAALVIAYIMEKYGLSYREALRHVQLRRFCVDPNDGFAQQLMEYEPIYRARMTLENGHSSKDKAVCKRKYIEEDDNPEEMDS